MLPFLTALVLAQTPATAGAPPSAGYSRFVTRGDGTMEMQTAAQRLVADGKPIVWLVGAIHIGRKGYYGELQRLLGYQDAVFYEGVRANAKAPGLGELPRSAPGAPTPTYKLLSDALGLDFQLADIDYRRKAWRNVDLTMEDLDRLNAKESGGKPSQFDQVKGVLEPGSPMAKSLSMAMGMATPGMKEAIKMLMIRVAGSESTPGLDPATERIILVARNRAVLDALDAAFAGASPPRAIGVFYGAKHLADLQRTLVEKYGYRLDEKRWFGAADADPKKIDATGQTLLDAFERAMAGKKG